MSRFQAAASSLFAAFLALGCGHPPSPGRSAARHGPLRPDPWVLTCIDPSAPEPAYLGNGTIGLRIGRDGTGIPNAFWVAGEYDAHQNLISLPNPLAGHWNFFDLQHSSHYLQALDMRTGILTTSWDQPNASIESEAFAHPDYAVICERTTVTAHSAISVAYVPAPAQYPMLRSKTLGGGSYPLVHGSVSPIRTRRLGKGERFQLVQVWSVDAPDVIQPPYGLLKLQTRAIWKKRWRTDIVVDGPSEDQQAIHSWLFYLRSSAGTQPNPLGPMGLSSALYKGHQFWDADTWMFPSLALIDPKRATAIAWYRTNRERAAVANSHGHGIRYPWESALTGEEVGPPESADQQHITGDVAFMLWQASALGLVIEDDAANAGELADQYYHSIATPSSEGLAIDNVRGPDEYHRGNNDLYTNALAQWLEDRYGEGHGTRDKGQGKAARYQEGGTRNGVRGAAQSRSSFLVPRSSYVLPHDSTSLLTYDDDPGRTYGQADAILAIYPLQNAIAEKEALTMMERFPPKTSPSSPAMSDSVAALIWARLNQPEMAYSSWQKSWHDFMDHPLGLFSEERRKDRTYFLTGAAGCLQTVLYGFLGFRIDWKQDQDAVWASRLHGNNWASFNPHLPPQWKSVTLRNFYLLGHVYTLVATHHRATVLEGEQ